MRLVLFHFFDGAVVSFEVFDLSEALNSLFVEVRIVRHRVTYCNDLFAHFLENIIDESCCLAFAAAGSYCADRNDRFAGFDLRLVVSHKNEVCAERVDESAFAHNYRIVNIAVSEYAYFNAEFFYKSRKFGFVINRNTVRVKVFTCEFFRILSSVDVRNLSSGESNYFVLGIVSEIGVEVVEISTGSTHDENFLSGHLILQMLSY